MIRSTEISNVVCHSLVIADAYDPSLVFSRETAFNMEGDSTLFALLSSQRNMLYTELGQHYLQQQDQVVAGPQLHLINTSIAERQLHADLLQSKRFSLDLGGSSDHFPMITFESINGSADKDYDMRGTLIKSPQKREANDVVDSGNIFRKKMRRLSSLGFLSASFFEDHATSARRASMASIATFASAASIQKPTKKESDNASVMSEIDDDGNGMASTAVGPMACNRPNLVASELKEIMEAFAEAMTQSQKSQQAIHDWDKQMGLKRSHSKTMRLSMRSRKKLKSMVRKNMSAIAA
jgi:hypothetical protein